MVMYDWELERSSRSFYFRVDLKNQWDLDILKKIRDRVRAYNKARDKDTQPHLRVWLGPRLGKNNPNAWKYHGPKRYKRYQMIHMEDARYVDVYIRERKEYAD